jgi:uncharacterized protein YndB with AHSA1/START domain
MATYRTTIDIDASPDRIWSVLSDVERWPEWTSSMTSVVLLDTGSLAIGSTARVKQPRLPIVVWTVTDLTPGRSFTWEARNPGAVSVATHEIEPRSDGGGSRVTLAVEQQGLVGRVVGFALRGLTRKYVDMEAAGLKRRVEAPRAGEPSDAE